MFRPVTLIPALIGLLVQPASAHLWETALKINARYNHPLYTFAGQQPGEQIAKYRWNRYFVYVTYFDGKCEDATYVHQDKTTFQQREIEPLLRAESLGMRWEKAATVPMWSLIAHDRRTRVAIAGYSSRLPDIDLACFGISTVTYGRRHRIPGI
jgi:hypothetical protein